MANFDIKNFVFVAVFVFVFLMFNHWFVLHRSKKLYLWEQKQKEKEKQIQLSREESKRYEDAYVTLQSSYLQNITNKSRIIMFGGEPGNGKSLSMDMMAKWLYDRQQWIDRKNKRYNTYMRPDYLKQKQRLIDEGLLTVYDNLGMTLGDLKTQPVLPVLEMLTQAIQGAVLALDEAGHYYPKEKYFELLKTKDMALKRKYDKLIEFVRFIRHYIKGWLLMTEQDEENLFIGMRRTGYARIKQIACSVYITAAGKRVSKLKHFKNRWLPAWLVGKPLESLKGKRTFAAKAFNLFKLLLPNWFNAFIYYEKARMIDEDVEKKYTEYKVLWEYEGRQRYQIFNNNQIFKYNTRSRQKDYTVKFNNQGVAYENSK